MTKPITTTAPPPLTADKLPHNEVIPVLDFGGQTAQLIARRLREAGAYAVLVSPAITAAELAALSPKGIVLSGGPASVYADGAPTCDPAIFNLGVPVLGICYGLQLMAHLLGCTVEAHTAREFGRANLDIDDASDLLGAIPQRTAVWMSHGDQIKGLAAHFDTLAGTPSCPHAVVRHKDQPLFGVQFHPEVTHTPHGVDLLRNFVYDICKCQGT